MGRLKYIFQTNAMLRITVHFAVALLVSYIYRGVGNDAARVLDNMKFVYGTNLFLAYTGLMAVIVSCEHTIYNYKEHRII